MRRKFIALTSAAAAVALMASACSSSKSSGSSANGAPSQGGSVTATDTAKLTGPTTAPPA